MRRGPGHGIVAGVDGCYGSLATVDVAAAEAQLRGVSLRLIAAHPVPGLVGPQMTLAAILRRVCATCPGLVVGARNITAEPVQALTAASRTADLIVVGQHTRERAERHRSVAALVAAHALCPTVVVPPHGAPATGEAAVLVGLGMSPEDVPAMEFAFEEANRRGVPLRVVHVWSGIPANAVGAVDPFGYDRRQAQTAADRMMAEALAGWADRYPDVTVERVPRYGLRVAEALLTASLAAGMIVVGARRNQLRSTQLLGPVASILIQEAPRPVVVLHPAW